MTPFRRRLSTHVASVARRLLLLLLLRCLRRRRRRRRLRGRRRRADHSRAVPAIGLERNLRDLGARAPLALFADGDTRDANVVLVRLADGRRLSVGGEREEGRRGGTCMGGKVESDVVSRRSENKIG